MFQMPELGEFGSDGAEGFPLTRLGISPTQTRCQHHVIRLLCSPFSNLG
jgi:hypothetical protein